MSFPLAAVALRSDAFRTASLRSEERRAYAAIAVIALIVIPVAGLTAAAPQRADILIVGSLAGFVLLAVQIVSILAVRRSRSSGVAAPRWLAPVGAAVECSVPTAAMLVHVKLGVIAPYVVVSLPPLLAYGILISLTTLRLRPAVSLLAGGVAAGGYAGLLAYIYFGLKLAPPADGWPGPAFLMTPVTILISGVAAAWVSRELRAHVIAALDEADLKQHLQRVEHDLDVARTIQQALLPRTPPVIPGFDIAGWNRPADQTGGDYYDWQRLPDGNWIITLADVSGHGVGPAMVTAACRAYVRASSVHHRDLPSLAARVNTLLAEDLPDGRFVTMAGVLLEPAGAPLALLSAGHGPIVLLLGATGEVRSIDPQGLPLAILPDAVFEPARVIDLRPGDVLALVTDGFVEWARTDASGRREEFGVERLSAALKRLAGLPAEEIIRGVADEVETFAGGVPQQDDLTMVVIRRC